MVDWLAVEVDWSEDKYFSEHERISSPYWIRKVSQQHYYDFEHHQAGVLGHVF